jgi:hypothetical protein
MVVLNSRSQQLAVALGRITIRDRLIPGLARELRRFFARQARDAVRRFLENPEKALGQVVIKATAGSIIPESDSAILLRAVIPRTQAMALASSRLAAEILNVEPLTATSPALQRILEDAGDRIRQINDATRTAVQRVLDQGVADRLDDRQIAQRLQGVVRETYRNRAMAIARTEMGLADQAAAHERYAASGVTHVLIFDGSECGWESHDDGDLANGSIRTLAEANSQPLSHPNCTRSSAPHVMPDGTPITNPA